MNNIGKDYKDILGESLTNLDDRGANTHKIMKGSGKATVSLAMVVGDLKRVVDNTRKKLDQLNTIISDYSKSSDNHARAMKWLTAGLFFVGIAQIITALILNN